jgi:glucose/arabinose dehydrogenase
MSKIPWLVVLLGLVLTSCVNSGAPASQPTPLAPFVPPTEPPPTSIVAIPYVASDPITSEPPTPSETASETPSPSATETPSATPTPDRVSSFPDPQAYAWVKVTGGLTRPLGLEHSGDGSGRLFVLEQDGTIRLVKDGEILQNPFLDIRDRVGSSANEQGLLGLAFHPGYPMNGFFFVNYTDRNGDTVIARYRVSSDPDRADPTTERRLLEIAQPYSNHNGGVTTFGPDGYLYLGLGDGGSGGDPQGNGQSLETLLGKVLRLDVDAGLASDEEPFYVIPPDNPFAGGGGRAEIWAYGLRNPWRFSFDQLTGDLYIADVGQNSYEEVNFQPADSTGGENYGWNIMEGFTCYQNANCDQSQLVLPIHVYPTRVDGNCSVTGGYVYRGSLQEWLGVYLYGDYCTGRVWGLLPGSSGEWENRLLFETGTSLTSFGLDEDGELYLVSRNGDVYRLEPAQ